MRGYFTKENTVRFRFASGLEEDVCTVDGKHDAAWITDAINEKVARDAPQDVGGESAKPRKVATAPPRQCVSCHDPLDRKREDIMCQQCRHNSQRRAARNECP
jgi:hypothetical protein